MVHEQFTRSLWVALWHLHTCHFAKESMNNIMLIHCKLIVTCEGSGSRQAGGCEDDAQSHHEHRVHKIMPGTEIFHITNN